MWRSIVLFLSLILLGTIGLHAIEDISLLDSLNKMITTIFKAGFREIKEPLSAPGQIFTIFIILGGVGSVLYTFKKLAEIIYEGTINKTWRRKKHEILHRRGVLAAISFPRAAFIVAVFSILILLVPSIAGEEGEAKYFELENGLKVFLYERHPIPLLNLVFAFDLGSKNELDETNGLVHILEHYILFGGTEKRTGEQIGREIRAHGAYFNAHTSLDLATFELSLPSEYADFALQSQREILFQLNITQQELDKEKQIILEELSQIQDDPLKRSTALVYQNLFQNHPYQRPIYGKKEVIESATAEKIQEFHDRYFVPANCALAVVGDFKIEEMEEKIKTIFGTLENNGFTPHKFEKVTPLKKDIEIEEEMDVNIGYLVIGMLGPDYNNEAQYAMDVLTEVLGRGVIPLINYSLRGRRKLVETVSMGYGAYKYGGLITVYLTLDPKKMKAAKAEALKFLKDARSLNYSKTDYHGEERYYALDYLESAKNQIKFRFHQSQEKGLGIALSMATHLILREDAERGKYMDNIETISSSDLRKTAGDYLSKGKQVIVSIVPQKIKNP